jgi:hypothetical protein
MKNTALGLTLVLGLSFSLQTSQAKDKDKPKELDVPKDGLKLEGTVARTDTKVRVEAEGKKGDLPAKLHQIKMVAKTKYVIEMDAEDQKQLDAFLVIQDKDGKQLAFDDDSGGGLNARLEFAPSANGTFKVYAASLRGEGKYTLKITPK